MGDTVLIVLFVAALALPATGWLLGLEAPTAGQTKRPVRVPAIEASWASFWSFPDRFGDYYKNHFTFRAKLIRGHAVAMYRGLGVSPSSTVLLGNDGWIYYADDESLTDYRSAKLFTQAELEKWKQTLVERRDWLARRNIRYLFVLVPDKPVIYPEHLPASIHRVNRQYRMEQLAAYLAAHSDLDVINLLPPLEAQKKIERIYHLTDTHWNDRGARVGYEAIMGRVAAWFPQAPGVAPLPLSAFEQVTELTPGWDLPVMVNIQDMTWEENLALKPRGGWHFKVLEPATHEPRWNDGMIVTQRDDASLPAAVVLRDSFGSALTPFLAEHFRRAVISWEYDFDIDLIAREKPDVVIQDMAGRKLYQVAPYNPAEVSGAARSPQGGVSHP